MKQIYFPQEVMYLIFSYDSTYKDKFDNVLGHLKRLFLRVLYHKHDYLFHNDIHFNINKQGRDIFYFIKNGV